MNIEADEVKYNFTYALEEGNWQNLYQAAAGPVVSTVRTGGFTGTIIGI